MFHRLDTDLPQPSIKIKGGMLALSNGSNRVMFFCGCFTLDGRVSLQKAELL